MSMEQVVMQLHAHGAPVDVLVKYLELIDNVDKRVGLAQKLQCHKAVVNVSNAGQRIKMKSGFWFKFKVFLIAKVYIDFVDKLSFSILILIEKGISSQQAPLWYHKP